MKNIVTKKENICYLWTDELIPENIGVIWDEEYAELIIKALKFYKERKND